MSNTELLMPYILKILNVALLASVKFFFSPLYAITIGLDFWGSYMGLILGGVLSFLGFYYATNIFLVYIKHLRPVIVKVTPNSTRLRYRNWKTRRSLNRKTKKRFNKKNRLFVRTRRSWGMWGIVLCTPILLSIPLGAILLRKYYGHRSLALSAGIMAIVFEGLILNSVFWFLIKGW